MIKRVRSAITGRFVKATEAKLHPESTIIETVAPKKKSLPMRFAAMIAGLFD